MRLVSEKDKTTPELQSDYVLIYNVSLSELLMLNNLITSAGYRSIVASSFKDADEKCTKNPPFAVVVDFSREPEQAVKLFNCIRKNKVAIDTLILFFCDDGILLENSLGLHARGYEYLYKPIELGPLKIRLESILQKKNWRGSITIPSRIPKKTIPEELPISLSPDLEQMLKNEDKPLPIPIPKIKSSIPVLKPAITETIIEDNNKSKSEVSENKSIHSPGKKNKNYFYDHAVLVITEQIERIRNDEPIKLLTIKQLSKELSDNIHTHPDLEVRALNRREFNSLSNRIINMTVFATLLGYRMKLSEQHLHLLTASALIHDLGMVKIPDSILKKESELSNIEFKAIKQHPDHTVKIVEGAVDFDNEADSSITRIVYQVHEREKGTGYPKGLESDQIDPLAKILAVADVFEAFSHPRKYRKSFMAYEAIQEVIKLKGNELASEVLKALVNELSIFPLHSYVQLNNKQIGQVIEINKTHSLRPVVEIKFDEAGKEVKPPLRLNLQEAPFLFVTKILPQSKLPKIDANGYE
ncbi:MAG: HD domain-containing phosphohydrolase [Candidatus Hatepunaea meridiana]|nr:HD domain-containing phosphohydrolase [Candidatus Hatepunaea meridiana]